jgi:hypothetical protein
LSTISRSTSQNTADGAVTHAPRFTVVSVSSQPPPVPLTPSSPNRFSATPSACRLIASLPSLWMNVAPRDGGSPDASWNSSAPRS